MKRPLMTAPLPFKTPASPRPKAIRSPHTAAAQPAAGEQPAAPVRRKKHVAKSAVPNQPRLAAKSIARKSSNSRKQRRERTIEALETRQVFAAPELTLSLPPGATIDNSGVMHFDLAQGSPLQIALDGYDADNDALSYTVEFFPDSDPNNATSNPSVTTELHATSNRSLWLRIEHVSSGAGDPAFKGELVFKLFDDVSPELTNKVIDRIVELVQSGFYDGILFHRIINNFVIQGGDPNTLDNNPSNDGQGGSGVQFDDAFDPSLQHTVSGLLSMAKTKDDTNDSQFFITEGNAQHLDFNHSIFGMLVDGKILATGQDFDLSQTTYVDVDSNQANGEDFRDLISNVPVNSSVPKGATRIVSAKIIQNDTDNQVLTVNTGTGANVPGTYRITINDGNSGPVTKQFRVDNIVADSRDNQPYLNNPTAPIVATQNGGPVQYQISATEIDGGPNPTTYNAFFQNPADASKVTLSINRTTGLLTVTPIGNFVGVVNIYILTSPLTEAQHLSMEQQAANANVPVLNAYNFYEDANTGFIFDYQAVAVVVNPTTPLTIDLLPGSDTGTSTSDDLTSKNNSSSSSALTFQVSGVTPGAIVQLFDGATLIGQATAGASATSVNITTNGTTTLSDGLHSITAHQQFSISAGNDHAPYDLPSNLNATTNVTIDATAPVIAPISTQSINEGSVFSYQVTANDTNGPLVYTLVSGPSGATVNQSTGVVSYTTLETDGGSTKAFTVRATDAAGVSSTVSFNLNVNDINNFNPVIAPIGQQNVTVNHELIVSINATDADLPTQTLSYELLSGPAGATIDANGAIHWTPDSSFAGTTQTFSFQVKDNAGGTTSASFDVYVNTAPVLTVQTNHTVDELQTLTFSASATDADVPAQTLAYSLSNAPAGMTINANTGVITWKPSEAQGPGSFTFQVTVTDSAGGSDSKTVNVTVNEVNQLPFLGALNTLTASAGETLTAQIPGSDADLPRQGLTYSLKSAPAGLTINATTGVISWTLPDTVAAGTVSFTVRLTDAFGDSVTRDYLIQVSPFNIGKTFGLVSQWTSTSIPAQRDNRPLDIPTDLQTAVATIINGEVAPVSVLGDNTANAVTSLLGGINRLQATGAPEIVEALKPIVEGAATGAVNESKSTDEKPESKTDSKSSGNPFDNSSTPAVNPTAPVGNVPAGTQNQQSRRQRWLDWREHLRSAALVETAADETLDLNWVSRAPQAPVIALPEPKVEAAPEIVAEMKSEPQPKAVTESESEPLAASVGVAAVASLALRPRKAAAPVMIPVVNDEIRRKRGPRRNWY